MRTLLLGVAVEVFAAILLAGIVLGLAIPLLNRGGLLNAGDVRTTGIIAVVPLGLVLIALLRPGSAIHRYIKR